MRFEMNSNTMKNSAMWSAAAVLAMCGSVATGVTQDTEVHVIASDENGDVHVERHIQSMMINEAGDKVTVTINGTVAEVFVNDKKAGEFHIDGDWTEQSIGGDPGRSVRIVKEPGGVLLIEQNGSSMKIGSPDLEFGQILQMYQGHGSGSSDLIFDAFNNGLNEARLIVRAMQTPPKVMLGVTMGKPNEAQVEKFGIDPEKSTTFGTVIEGLPAARAGLLANDVVIGVEGADDASPEAIRERLASLAPGDSIRFKVIGEAGEKSIEVKLDPYDAAALGVPQVAEEFIWEYGGEDDAELTALRQQQDELTRRYAEAMQNSLSADGQRARERAGKEAARLNEELKKVTGEIAKKMARRNTRLWIDRFPGEQGGELQITPDFFGSRDGELFVLPERFGEHNRTLELLKEQLADSHGQLSDRETRIAELEARLEAMNQKMDRLEAILLELKERSNDQ